MQNEPILRHFRSLGDLFFLTLKEFIGSIPHLTFDILRDLLLSPCVMM